MCVCTWLGLECAIPGVWCCMAQSGAHPDPSEPASQALSADPPFASVSLCLAGGSPGNATQDPGSSLAPGPEQPPTPAVTRAASVPRAHPASQILPERLNLTGAVRVLCELEKVAIAIQRRFLQQESIPESSLYLGHPSCNVSYRNSTHVLLVAGWTECGTVVQSVSPRMCKECRGEGAYLSWGIREH